MDKCLDYNLESNFEKAINMFASEYSYDDLISLLKQNEILEKQFAILNLEEIKSIKDAKLLCSNLVGQDGKIREATAFKLSEFFDNKKFSTYFELEDNYKIMIKGLTDINGNVCRSILEIQSDEFNKFLAKNLPEKTIQILKEIELLTEEDKQYVISKRNFQLYWALEGIFKVSNLISFDEIKDILTKTSSFDDYTIREKSAKILSRYNTKDAQELKSKLSKDENCYVSRHLCL